LIEHVATRDKLRFSSSGELLRFIESHSGIDELSIPFGLEADQLLPEVREREREQKMEGSSLEIPDAELD
jgi:hypothetical protein